MQILKDEVRNNILKAATEEFLVDGYRGSSLRTIASQAGITIGNIYSYFSSKDDLFETVIESAMEGLKNLSSLDFGGYERKDQPSLIEITNRICEVFIVNKEGFLIIMNGSEGSKFENVRQNIINFISDRVKKELYPKAINSEIDPLFAKALASGLVASFITVFNGYGGDKNRLFNLVNELIYVALGNIEKRL